MLGGLALALRLPGGCSALHAPLRPARYPPRVTLRSPYRRCGSPGRSGSGKPLDAVAAARPGVTATWPTVAVRSRPSPPRANQARSIVYTSLLHPRVVGRVGVHGRAAPIDGVRPQLEVPRLVAVDLAQPVARRRARTATPAASEGPMSTASPDTWADVSGVATHRAASASEPYFAIASRSSCSWYAAERQPLSTTNATPSPAASVAARRRAASSAGSRLATPGSRRRRRVVPSGTAPSASPSAAAVPRARGTRGAASRARRRGRVTPAAGGSSDAAIAAMTASRPATRSRRIRVRDRCVACWSGEVMPPVKAARRCGPVCGFRYAGDMRRLVASEACAC